MYTISCIYLPPVYMYVLYILPGVCLVIIFHANASTRGEARRRLRRRRCRCRLSLNVKNNFSSAMKLYLAMREYVRGVRECVGGVCVSEYVCLAIKKPIFGAKLMFIAMHDDDNVDDDDAKRARCRWR